MGTKLKLKKKTQPSPAPKSKSVGGVGPKGLAVNAKPKSPEPTIPIDQQLNASELDGLISASAEQESDGRKFMEPQGAVPKRGRGRPKNAEKAQVDGSGTGQAPEAPTQSNEPTADLKPTCKVVFGITSAWIVRYTEEPRLALLPSEIDDLSAAWAAVGEKWLPVIVAQYGVEIAAFGVTGIAAMRLYQVSSKLIDEKRKARESHALNIAGSDKPRPAPTQAHMTQ